jgi:hypothetical protein
MVKVFIDFPLLQGKRGHFFTSIHIKPGEKANTEAEKPADCSAGFFVAHTHFF